MIAATGWILSVSLFMMAGTATWGRFYNRARNDPWLDKLYLSMGIGFSSKQERLFWVGTVLSGAFGTVVYIYFV